VQVQQPPPPQNTISAATNTPPPTTSLTPPAPPAQTAAPAAAPKGPSRTAAVVDFNTCSKPEYPKSSLRNEETGVSTILFKIAADGSVQGASIQKSSGFRDLDKAAMAALSKCRFKAATENGQAVESSQPVQYVWTLD
jgi:protein TonB